jgi:hypothetical protein
VADVAQARVQPHRHVDILCSLALNKRVAELVACPPPCLLCRHAAGAEIVFAFVDVKGDLTIDVSLETR